MARIIVQAVHGAGEPRRWKLSERVVSKDLANEPYSTQLLGRVGRRRTKPQRKCRLRTVPAHHNGGTAAHRQVRSSGKISRVT
jgi:hypothetical protein